jgi:Cd2+/Zn2+-exporting ATPase
MELGIKSLDGINEASIDFVTKKLRIKLNDDIDTAATIKEIESVVKNIEANVKLLEVKNRKSAEEDSNRGHKHESSKLGIVKLGIGALLFVIAFTFKFSNVVELGLYLALKPKSSVLPQLSLEYLQVSR